MYGRGTIIRMGKFAHLIESLLKIKQQINKRKEQEHTKLDAKYNFKSKPHKGDLAGLC